MRLAWQRVHCATGVAPLRVLAGTYAGTNVCGGRPPPRSTARSIAQPSREITLGPPAWATGAHRGAPVLLVAAAIAAQSWAMGPAVVVLDAALLASYALWATRPEPAPPRRVLPALALAIVVQLAHLAEEFQAGFQRAFPALFGYAWGDTRFLAFNAAWLVVFVASAVAVARGRRLGYLGATFLAVGGGIGNGLGHLALAAQARGYFPGAYTAPLALGAGTLLLVRLRERRPPNGR